MQARTETLRTAGQGLAVRPACRAVSAEAESAGKNLLLFFCAPFIGLAYLIAFPFIGYFFLGRSLYRRVFPFV